MKPTIGWGVLAMFLLHPVPSATAPRTVASAASGWIDVGSGGTRFYNTPQALCPNGTLRYESEEDVTCSNADIWGTWAYACPIGYLPETYPRGWWSSRLAGPYGTAPDGSVPLGVGPGGPNVCVQNAPEPLPNLTLTSVPEMKPIGLPGYTDAPLIANVKKAGAPVAGVPITFSINVLAHSGLHEHHDNQRPLGTLSSFSGITDANGDIQIRFKAPDVAGTHTITANCGACANPTVSANINVKVPGLLPISPISPRKQDGSYVYALTSVDHTHAGNGRYHRNQYYLSQRSLQNLLTLIEAFSDEGWGTVALNDASLPWGGRYDIRADWKAPHAGHREGREIDISFSRAQNPVSVGKQKSFYKKFCEERAAQVPFSLLHHYALQPHFHVYLEKQSSCWTTEK